MSQQHHAINGRHPHIAPETRQLIFYFLLVVQVVLALLNPLDLPFQHLATLHLGLQDAIDVLIVATDAYNLIVQVNGVGEGDTLYF